MPNWVNNWYLNKKAPVHPKAKTAWNTCLSVSTHITNKQMECIAIMEHNRRALSVPREEKSILSVVLFNKQLVLPTCSYPSLSPPLFDLKFVTQEDELCSLWHQYRKLPITKSIRLNMLCLGIFTDLKLECVACRYKSINYKNNSWMFVNDKVKR